MRPLRRRTRKEVKKLLRQRGLRTELARRCNVSLSMISHWTRGRAWSSKVDAEFEAMVVEKGLTV